MIPRYQRILFLVFLTATIIMAAVLIHLRRAARERLTDSMADAPLVAPSQMPRVTVHLLVANDLDDSLNTVDQKLSLPDSANAAARFVLLALFAEYSKPLSPHPLPSGGSVEDVFLLPLKGQSATPAKNGTPQIAVVNLDRSFAETHPSGLATEMLTIRSIVATLHANLPQVQAVRFLVGGQESDTLSGHADLRRVYSTSTPYTSPEESVSQ